MTSSRMSFLGLSLIVAAGCAEGKKGEAECGNGLIEGSELCDGTDMGDSTCLLLGLGGGDLACTPTCGYDTSGCDTASICGDGFITSGETCDGDELAEQTCASLGLGGGTLACSASCGWDTTGCDTVSICGDGFITSGETCDGDELAGRDCEDEGFASGTLACNGMCDGYDTTGCTAAEECGDGVITGDEVCDGTNLGTPARTCVDEGYRAGTLACLGTCLAFDVSGCTYETVCGNGEMEFPEECDGTVPVGVDCTRRGFYGGTVTCGADCTLDVSGCEEGYCGDGTANGAEPCDGTDLGAPAATCADQGFAGGMLACTGSCTFDASACTGGCGNGVRETGETCDGADLGTHGCTDESMVDGVLGCTADCSGYDTTECLATAVCTADGAVLGALRAKDIVTATGDTTGATDTVTSSCTSTSATATPEVAFEVILLDRGVLTVETDNYWHVLGVYADSDTAGSCFTAEIMCMDPYFDGNPMVLGTFDPGRYYLVMSDWDESTSTAFHMTVGLSAPGAEICNDAADNDSDGLVDCTDSECASSPFCTPETACANGTDEDLDFFADCADTDCIGSADCTGSACAADEDLGTLAIGLAVTRTVPMASAGNDLSLPCSSSDGMDHVLSFTLAGEARLGLVISQDTGSQHAAGLYMQAGTGSACTDAQYACWDLSTTTTSPAISGIVGTFPAGTYYLVVEATATSTGSFTAALTAYASAETVCSDGLDDDGDGDVDCGDFECLGAAACTGSACTPDHDFGTISIGDTVTHTGDTSTSANTLHLSCAGTDGNDYVVAFTITEPAMVYTSIDQATGSGHATALTFQAGAGTGCTASENLCLDLSSSDYSPDASGYLSYPEPLPAGTYYMVAEAVATAGTMSFLFTAYATLETSCTDDADNDGDDATDCADSDCASFAGCIESICDDDTDNDGDGATDCHDSDCASFAGCEGFSKGIYELFEEGTEDVLDLDGGMLTFTPASWHPQGYVWAYSADVPGLPYTPGRGTTTQALDLGDDEAAEITFSTFGGFPFYGESRGVLNVASNGVLSFGPDNAITSFFESTFTLFTIPTLSPMWDDMDPGSGGTVTYDESAGRVVVTFSAVPELASGTWTPVGANTMQVVLFEDGHFIMAYDGMTCLDGLVGISNGGGAADLPPETNFN